MISRTPEIQEETLAAFLHAIHPLTANARDYINKHSFKLELKKGQLLIEAPSDKKFLYFICQGVIRGFFKVGGKEITTWINEEKEIIGTITNLGLDIPNEEYLQALEFTRLIGIPQEAIEYCYSQFPETNIIGRLLLEDNYRGAEERSLISRIPSATERYERFVTRRPHLLYRVPLKYIASYLGMTHETLCRLRAKYKVDTPVCS